MCAFPGSRRVARSKGAGAAEQCGSGDVNPLLLDSSGGTMDGYTNRFIMESTSDGVLVSLSMAGDARAFSALFHRYQPAMRRYAVHLLGSNADADDVVQEAMIAAWQKLPTLQNPNLVRTWLMRIVRNRSIDRLRSGRPEQLPLDDELPIAERSCPADIVLTLFESQALDLAVRELPPLQRIAWVRREYAGCSYSDIAQELDVPSSTVRGLLARARCRLARELEAWR